MREAFHLSSNADEVAKWLNVVAERHIPYAVRRAINTTAQDVVREEREEILRVFDRPNPVTQRAVSVWNGATKERSQAIININDEKGKAFTPPSYWLWTEVEGGRRGPKRYERALQAAGVMPQGWVSVPGRGAEIDQYGNVKAGTITQILSWFRAFREQGFRANATDKTRASRWKGTKRRTGWRFLASLPNNRADNLPYGIWREINAGPGAKSRTLHPVLFFVPAATYRRRLDFYGIAEKTAATQFPVRLDEAMAHAIATAR